MASDPHAIPKILSCTSRGELRGLLDGWNMRGVVLSPAEKRTAQEKAAMLLQQEKGRQR